ncbi:MAG: hypothetical protein WAQ24_00920 [Candidatus Saccharimonadales bacterium]
MTRKKTLIDIDDASDINDQNLYEIDFRSKRNEFDQELFKENIDYLWQVGQAIKEAVDNGFLAELTNASIVAFYQEALRWLKGQAATTNWIVVQPFIKDAPDLATRVQQFNDSWMSSFRSTITANQVVMSFYVDRVKKRRTTSAEQLRDVIEELTAQVKIELEGYELQRKKTFDDEHSRQIEEYKKSAAVEEWQRYYSELIMDHQRPSKERVKFLKYPDEAHSSYRELMGHYNTWKNIWLGIFFLTLVLSVGVVNCLGWTIRDDLINIISIKLGIIVMFGSLFMSSNKNYRVYANLYDQTRLRDVTARTIQGILLDKRFDREDTRILLAVAAQTLFEMKPNGHLTKKDTGSPMNELLVGLISKTS